MEEEKIRGKSVVDLVRQNGVYAYALYHLGIKFYEYSEQTLEQVCREKGLSLQQVTRELERPNAKMQDTPPPLHACPIDLTLAYLKHDHLIFVKYKLPYIASLIESFCGIEETEKRVERDLKILFPLFIEDFIHHIYEEEDTLFHYIQVLEKAEAGTTNPSQLYYMMERNSMRQYATEHEMYDSEMRGLREITNGYLLYDNMPLQLKIIYTELEGLEKSLNAHAHIENKTLFPCAIALEKRVREKTLNKVKYN